MRTHLELFEEFGTPVYPGHPVALACYALVGVPTLDAALVPTGPNSVTLVSAKTVVGAVDALQATATMLGKLQRGETVEGALKWANDWWARCIRSHQPAFDKRLVPGQEQAKRMEELFAELVTAARARAAELAAEAAAAANATATPAASVAAVPGELTTTPAEAQPAAERAE
ncbi:MAG TPA: hypothetical protein VFS33_11360 [Gemmatimonadales bacterium]|nr:hypothetical protein [Gemmatimonadales bacterium]